MTLSKSRWFRLERIRQAFTQLKNSLADVEPVSGLRSRRLLATELVVVLLVTFGLSGLYGFVGLVEHLVNPVPLNEQTTAINSSVSPHSLIDFSYQLLRSLRLFAWAALPLLLLAYSKIGLQTLGLGREHLRGYGRGGLALAVLIAVPGLALYVGAVHLGYNSVVAPADLNQSWWYPITLTVSAAANACAEEVIVVGYLLIRLRQLGIPIVVMVGISAVLRGSYHLYQGFGGGLGNLAMGVVFAIVWLRWRSLWPLIVAHFLIDFVAFLGYALLASSLSFLPGL